MGLAYKDNAAESIAVDLYAFFEPHKLTDQAFDETCGWIKGSTRELLEKIRLPTPHEMVEICLRLNHPLYDYIRCTMPDGEYLAVDPPWAKCTDATPCCDFRMQAEFNSIGQRTFDCPRQCLCHH
jgi:hypothetical protein